MGVLKIIIFLILLSVIINIGLHHEIIKEAQNIKEEAETYVIERCNVLERQGFNFNFTINNTEVGVFE